MGASSLHTLVCDWKGCHACKTTGGTVIDIGWHEVITPDGIFVLCPLHIHGKLETGVRSSGDPDAT